MSDHEGERERISLYALGCLDEREAELAVAHIASCTSCSKEYSEMNTAAALIGYAVEPLADVHELRLAAVKKRIMAEVRRPDRARFTPHVPIRSSFSTTRSERLRSQKWFQRPEYLQFAVAASLIVAFASGAASLLFSARLHQTQLALAQTIRNDRYLQAVSATQSAQLALMLTPGSQRYDVGHGLVLRSNDHLAFILRSLPPLSKGYVYQAWTLPKGSKVMKPGATFVASSDGGAYVALPDSPAQTAAVAVSVEPAGGSRQPTSKPLFVQVFG